MTIYVWQNKKKRADKNSALKEKIKRKCLLSKVRWKQIVAGLEIGSNVQTARTLCQS